MPEELQGCKRRASRIEHDLDAEYACRPAGTWSVDLLEQRFSLKGTPDHTPLQIVPIAPLTNMSPSFTTHSGQLYNIQRKPKPLVAFEHVPTPTSEQHGPQNTVIFLGGLFDGLQTVPYVAPLVASLPRSWTLVEPVLGSNYRQWGFSSLDDDVAEIALLVEFFRNLRPGGKVVLLGHSTGSQMVMHYLLSDQHDQAESKSTRPKIDGGIMQASVSDREAVEMMVPKVDIYRACVEAQQMMKAGKGGDLLPFGITDVVFPKTPVTAFRWLSIASPGPEHLGQDDYFSSDLSDERLEKTFGQLGKQGTRVAWLVGEKDQYVPSFVDRGGLIRRWHHFASKGGAVVDASSGIVKGTSHTLEEGGVPTEELTKGIVEFLERVEGAG